MTEPEHRGRNEVPARQEAHEIYAASKPRVGDPVTYEGAIAGNVVRVEGNLCWTSYVYGTAPFIWAFREGLNTMHNWPGKKS